MINWREVAEVAHDVYELSKVEGVSFVELMKCAIEQGV